MKRRGITITEVLVVVVILAILMALLFPAFAKAKMESKAAATKISLRGFYQGLLLYQADYEERVQFGPVSEMGLPHAGQGFANFMRSYTKVPSNEWLKHERFFPCGLKLTNLHYLGLWYFGNYIGPTGWESEVQKYKEKTVVLADMNCNEASVDMNCQFCDKRSIGITLTGQILDRRSSEYKIDQQEFYH